ncbi:hypothetical protein V8C86DRAFT_2753715 [Haematococcus lacustris]
MPCTRLAGSPGTACCRVGSGGSQTCSCSRCWLTRAQEGQALPSWPDALLPHTYTWPLGSWLAAAPWAWPAAMLVNSTPSTRDSGSGLVYRLGRCDMSITPPGSPSCPSAAGRCCSVAQPPEWLGAAAMTGALGAPTWGRAAAVAAALLPNVHTRCCHLPPCSMSQVLRAQYCCGRLTPGSPAMAFSLASSSLASTGWLREEGCRRWRPRGVRGLPGVPGCAAS